MVALMKILGLDVGDKTIGVAISDGLMLTAQGRTTVLRKNLKSDIDEIMEFIVTENITNVVVGLPRNLNDTIGPQGEKVMSFAKSLEKKIKYSDRTKGMDVKVEYFDERFTTKIADRVLIDADMSRKKRKDVVDKLAAVVILQGYLDLYNNMKQKN
jgi:putative holliday junction resolvase